MKNILIPTDFSENSQNAIRYALEYFSNVAVNFYMLHVSLPNARYREKQPETLFGGTAQADAGHSARMLLDEEVKNCQLLSKNPGHQFFPIEENVMLVEAIRKQLAEYEIDTIVMGTSGGSAVNQGEIGSNTYEVITKVKCPVMVIPENARFRGIKNLAFVTDYNCIYRNKVISRLSQALHLHQSPLRVLHIRPQNSSLTPAQVDNKGFLHYFFKDIKHSFHFLENTELEVGIQDFVDTWEISMIGIPAKNLNFIQRLMLRPATNTNNYHSDIPFLVLHE